MSFVAKFQRSQCGNIVLYFGRQSGIACYFYIRLNPLKRDAFFRIPEGDALVPSEWGEVLCYGAGKTPSEKHRAYMLETFGFVEENTEK